MRKTVWEKQKLDWETNERANKKGKTEAQNVKKAKGTTVREGNSQTKFRQEWNLVLD